MSVQSKTLLRDLGLWAIALAIAGAAAAFWPRPTPEPIDPNPLIDEKIKALSRSMSMVFEQRRELERKRDDLRLQEDSRLEKERRKAELELIDLGSRLGQAERDRRDLEVRVSLLSIELEKAKDSINLILATLRR